ncbi:MAG: cation diffusion facilitator family transporter, partial [Eubacteriales bacterium]|nr:cation diffusion facilitator family transporter [Eubacteriales bacterium]
KVRAAYGTLGSVTGIIVNILLSATKFILGVVSGSLAITADAVNNLSDAAGSIMSLVSVRMAGKPDDAEHPFGHGRMEYIGALAVGVLILVAGVKLLRDGFDAVLNPETLAAGPLVLGLLLASILVKLWLFFYYRAIARAINNDTLAAASKDSLSDVAATGAVLVSVALQTLFGWRIDGYMSLLVALFVLKTGLSVCRETIDRLLGEKPNPELTREIKQKMLSYDGILGVHDLVVHDYGPGRCIASVHAEVSATGDIVAVHETIDKAERELKNDLGIVVCIHMDPTVTDDPRVNEVHKRMAEFLKEEDPRLSLHDFRMVPGQRQVNLVFDCLLPDDYQQRDQLKQKLAEYARQLDPRYEVIVQFDMDYT